jgi:hypothetical protein
MKRVLTALLAVSLFLLAASPAGAFEIQNPEFLFEDAQEGDPVTTAGAHPFGITTTFSVDRERVPEGGRCFRRAETPPGPLECEVPSGQIRDLRVLLPAGFIGNQTAAPRCSGADFATITKATSQPACEDGTAIGVTGVQAEFDPVEVGRPFPYYYVPVWNLETPPGAAAKFGFIVQNVPVTTEIRVSESFPYNLEARLHNVSQAILFYGAELTIWGNPASPVHDPIRGHCIDALSSLGFTPSEIKSLGDCPAEIEGEPVPEEALITTPRSCQGTLTTSFAGFPWENPLEFATAFAQTPGMDPASCAELEFDPTLTSAPTAPQGESPTGLDVGIEVEDEGLLDPEGRAKADIAKTVLTLPEGMTLNTSAANGLEACTKAQLEAASLTSYGCPAASKLGTAQIMTPLLDEALEGSLYVASQDDNPFGSLFAVYLVIRNEKLGVLVKQPGRIDLSDTGRVTTVFEDLPQFPLASVQVHLRSGPKAPLLAPRECRSYGIEAELSPSSGGAPVQAKPAFTISTGPGGGGCLAGPRPFRPGFSAGTQNPAAGSYSPLSMRITRSDGEADITRLDATLPAGVVARIAGLGRCSDAALEAARARSGRAEIAAPSCPSSSQVGRVEAGAGTGSELVYVEGRIYLAGPFGANQLSVAVVTPAVAGPFDLGNVVIRQGLRLNPVSGRAEIDGAASDPIPTILKGVPLHLRDLRVFVDRPGFTLNATNCNPLATEATLWSGGAPFGATDRYQATGCGALGYKPKLTLKLLGATKRGKFPRVRSLLIPRAGDANTARAVVTMPPSVQIENAHINNPCTRVQFNAGACPPKSILGKARAYSPLLDQPLEGPVYFRSNGGERELPDLVADLNGLFHVTLVGFIDTKGKRLRTTFANVPDAPVSRFELNLAGGKKGLLVFNRNICKHKQRAKLSLTAQNGRPSLTNQVIGTSCKGKGKGGKRKKGGKGKGR